MPPRIAIELRKPYTGEYDFDIEEEPLTNFEWRVIKRVSGYLPVTVGDGWTNRDPDLFVAFAVIALVRAGKVDREQAVEFARVFDDVPSGTAIRLVDEEPAAEDPTRPVEAPTIEQPLRSIGGSSPQTLESQVVDLSRTGALA